MDANIRFPSHDVMKCAKCNAELADDANFCTQCGTRVALDVTMDQAAPTLSLVPGRPNPAMVPAANWSAGDVLLDDYVIQRELGRGGMGIVYLVRSRATGHEFAVKTARLADDYRRRLFLKELYTWLDLPRHPHIVGCRFFRTIGDQLVIFAEYVAGESLAQSIRGKRLSLPESILDVAIQFAWGLAAAHQAEVIHRDVKPDNALLATDGTLKVGDFGLSSARAAALRPDTPTELSITSAGMTLPYRSPEQARGERLTRHTDVWSWAVSVLEMYSGGLQWKFGEDAPAYLERHAQEATVRSRSPIQAPVLAVLRKCFHRDPKDRWDSLLDAAEELERAYESIVGHQYPRILPGSTIEWRDNADLSRHFQEIGHDAVHWLSAALEATSQNAELAHTFFKGKHHTQAAHLAEQIAAFEEARQIIERAIHDRRDYEPSEMARLFQQAGLVPSETAADEQFKQLAFTQQSDLEEQLARLCVDAAYVHRLAGDYGGAIARHDQALAICRRWAGKDDLQWVSLSLMAEHEKAITLECAGEYSAAQRLFDEAIYRCLSRAASPHPQSALMIDSHLAQLYLGKASVCFRLRDLTSAVGLQERAIAILKRVRDFDPQPKVIALLARAYRDSAIVATAIDDHYGAAEWTAAAAALQYGIADSASFEQAEQLMERARTQFEANPQEAIDTYRQALAIYEQIVDADKQRLFAPRLVKCCGNLALALAQQGDHAAALALYDRAAARLDEVISQEGRQELERELVRIAINRAISLREIGRSSEAMSCLGDCIQRIERLRIGRDDPELDHLLALSCCDQAYLHVLRRAPGQAASLYHQACTLWRQLVHERGRRDLTRYLSVAEANLRSL